MKVMAKQNLRYAGKERPAGTIFEIFEEKHANLLIRAGRIERYYEPEQPAPRAKRRYTTRAMKAETL